MTPQDELEQAIREHKMSWLITQPAKHLEYRQKLIIRRAKYEGLCQFDRIELDVIETILSRRGK